MFELDSGNVLLKPSQRKQLNTSLKRCLKFGQRLREFFLRISMHRTGKLVEIQARLRSPGGERIMKVRRTDWQDAARALVRMLTAQLHARVNGLAIG
jgi:hypothetical protein